jgi:hypothetical protein
MLRPSLLVVLLVVLPLVIVLVLVGERVYPDAPVVASSTSTTVDAGLVPAVTITKPSTTTTTTVTTTSTSMPRSHETAPTSPPAATPTGDIWDRLADCESGEWDANRQPIAGTADWASTSDGYEGGVHFMNSTWLGAGGGRYAPHAHLATREQQIDIAKTVLRGSSVRQQWPVCGPKVGLTMAAAA